MRHGSLFSGIGGFDLAAEWMGWENVFHCEWNPFCQKVINHYWPNSKSYEDITKSDFTQFRGRIDVITGGFPCQPFSTAGKRQGTEDSRYLWPEMLRAIREVQPRYIVGENVRGLLNWDGGLVFDTVCADLESGGYEVLPVLLPAAGVNAPHIRQRIFFIAKKNSSDPYSPVLEHGYGEGEAGGRAITQERAESFSGPGCWEAFPTVSPICNGDDGLSGRLDSITFSKWRKQSLMAGGNAIVPQVAYQIFKTIEEYERLSNRLPTESED